MNTCLGSAPVIRHEHDVLIIGGGGAGAYAAIWAARHVSRVAILEKGIFGNSGCTPMAGFSMCAAAGIAEPKDTPQVHMWDTLKGGQFVNNQQLVKNYTEEAPERIYELVNEFGCRLSMENGRLHQAQMPGHTYPRAFHYERKTGPMVMRSLARKAKQTPGVEVFRETVMLDLVHNPDGKHHVIAMRWRDGALEVFSARTVIIATGSAAQIYRNTTSSLDNTGDGLSLLYKAGATLSDMEFVQFYPTTQCYPHILGLGPTCPAFLRLRTGARLYNARGEHFMDEKMPDWRFKATRDYLAQCIYREIREGRGTEHGGVYIDLLHLDPETIRTQFAISNYYEGYLRSGVDLTKDAIETTVAAHYFMGGAVVDQDGETTLANLYCAGEATAGYHGANRLGGNAMTEVMVSGQRAGLAAALRARELSEGKDHPELADRVAVQAARLKKLFAAGGTGVRPVDLKQRLKDIMWEHVGVVRNEAGLSTAVQELDALAEQLPHIGVCAPVPCNRELLDAFEIEHMLRVARVIASAALFRKETRGAHYREDFPTTDNRSWLVNLDCTAAQDGMRLESRPVALTYMQPEM